VTAARPDLHHSGDKAGQEEQMTRVDLYQEAQARLREFFARGDTPSRIFQHVCIICWCTLQKFSPNLCPLT
jgi:hypothetical protein